MRPYIGKTLMFLGKDGIVYEILSLPLLYEIKLWETIRYEKTVYTTYCDNDDHRVDVTYIMHG